MKATEWSSLCNIMLVHANAYHQGPLPSCECQNACKDSDDGLNLVGHDGVRVEATLVHFQDQRNDIHSGEDLEGVEPSVSQFEHGTSDSRCESIEGE